MEYTQIKRGLLHGLLTGDKFVLDADLRVLTHIRGYFIKTRYIELYKDGALLLKLGFEWDGASGPTWDTEKTMEASAVHDAFYRLMHYGLLPVKDKWMADNMLYWLMRKNGCSFNRAILWLIAVALAGKLYVKPNGDKKRLLFAIHSAIQELEERRNEIGNIKGIYDRDECSLLSCLLGDEDHEEFANLIFEEFVNKKEKDLSNQELV